MTESVKGWETGTEKEGYHAENHCLQRHLTGWVSHRARQRCLGHVPHDGRRLRHVHCRTAARRRLDCLLGRVSFQLFNIFWPEVAKNPTSEKWTPEQRELSQAGASVPTIVVLDTLTGNWPAISIIRRADAHQKIAELKRQPGKNMLITGSRTLWNDLLAHDLIDEIHLMIGNVVFGEGVPVFVSKPPASLRLIDVRTWEHSDNVLLRYAVRRTGVETL